MFRRMGYEPTPEQAVIHFDPARIKLVSGGEQAGKSKTSGMELAAACLMGNTFWICADSYEMTQTEFYYCLESLQAIEAKENIKLIDSYHWSDKDKSHIRLANGKVNITTKSLKEAVKVAMVAPDGIVVCEADQIEWPTIERLLMRVTRSQGWVLLAGTYESSFGWQAVKWKEWQGKNNLGARSFSLPTWTNKICFPGGRDDPKLKQWEVELPPGKFMERFGGVPCPPTNLVIPEFKVDVHVQDVVYNPDVSVEIALDPGYSGSVYACEVLQVVGDSVDVIDEVYVRHCTTEDIIRALYHKPYFGNITAGACDVAGTQHQGTSSVVEIVARPIDVENGGGLGIWLANQKVPVNEGIERLRMFFHVDPVNNKPKVRIAPHCRGLISELGGCKGPFEDSGPWLNKIDSQGHLMGPMDRCNHATKALIYWIVNKYGFTRSPSRAKMSAPDKWYRW